MVHNFFEKHHWEHREVWIALVDALGVTLPLPYTIKGSTSGLPGTRLSFYWEASLPFKVVVQFKLTLYIGEQGLLSFIVPPTAQFEYQYAIEDCLSDPFHYAATVVSLGDPIPKHWIEQLLSEADHLIGNPTNPKWPTSDLVQILGLWSDCCDLTRRYL